MALLIGLVPGLLDGFEKNNCASYGEKHSFSCRAEGGLRSKGDLIITTLFHVKPKNLCILKKKTAFHVKQASVAPKISRKTPQINKRRAFHVKRSSLQRSIVPRETRTCTPGQRFT
jgi:hypothetical protein